VARANKWREFDKGKIANLLGAFTSIEAGLLSRSDLAAFYAKLYRGGLHVFPVLSDEDAAEDDADEE
jgi:hypothetical protein